MADPLSIAGSVVGITAAGVQASVKLYALAEKVATASQRVTSIADDVSSTCAILNQVRELIIPQPDAQGTLKSVFNSTALHDISHGLQRCRSAFTEIEALLRRAFEQVGKRPALRSKIELSRFEKAKWPFLQPQFDELRNDLRDAKGNLILMIAVASLALAQRDGRQRPIHETERLELGSTIVQLQQARISNSNDQNSPKRSQQEGMRSRQLFGQSMTVGPARDTRSEQTSVVSVDPDSGFRTVKYMRATPLSPQEDTIPTPLVSERTSDPSSVDAKIGDADMSLPSVSNVQMQEQWNSDMFNPSIEEANINSAILSHTAASTACFGQQTRDVSGMLQERHAPGHNTHRTPAPAMSASDWSAVDLVYEEQPGAIDSTAMPSAQRASENTLYYCGWITRHLQGLTTGFGDSLSITQMNLPDQSLEKLVKNYADAGLDPHISLLDLTEQQQDIIKQVTKNNLGAELAYVSISRDIKVSSVFGMLDISGLKWIAASRKPWPKREPVCPQYFPPPFTRPPPSLPGKPFLYPSSTKTTESALPPQRAQSYRGDLYGPPPPRPYGYMSSSANSRPFPPAPPSEEQRTDSRAKERAEKHLAEKEKDRAVAREESRRLKDEERGLKEEEQKDLEKERSKPPTTDYLTKPPSAARRMSSTITPAQLADQQRLIEFEKAQMRSEKQIASHLSETNTGYEQSLQYPGWYAQQYQPPAEENGEDIVNELLARWTTLERPDYRLKDDKHRRYSRRY
jgi:hypothetical protein